MRVARRSKVLRSRRQAATALRVPFEQVADLARAHGVEVRKPHELTVEQVDLAHGLLNLRLKARRRGGGAEFGCRHHGGTPAARIDASSAPQAC